MSHLPNELGYSDLCNLLWNQNSNSKIKRIDFLMQKLNSEYTFSECEGKRLRRQLTTTFLTEFTIKWKAVARRKELFKVKYNDFLQKKLTLNITENNENVSDAKVTFGRPRLSFEESSYKTKMRRAKELAENHTMEELLMALKIKQKEKNVKVPDLDDESDESFYSNNEKNEALAMFFDTDLSKEGYRLLREYNLQFFQSSLYPPYDSIVKAKQDCYPNHIEVTDLGASVHFIALIDHTIERIFSVIDKKELESLNGEEPIEFLAKWGMDGAGDQQTTRQSWSLQENEEDVEPSDKSIFMTSFVPLRLRIGDKTLWENPKPNSVLYCRPVSYYFIKETISVIKNNYKKYSQLLNKIKNYCFQFGNRQFNIKFNIKCTMLDGKAGNAITGQNSSASCNICCAKPSEMNAIDLVLLRKCKTEFYKLGFPMLHSWIRFMEYILHIAYNLDFKEHMAKGSNKILKKNRKAAIQTSLRNELQLSVDIVKQGFGTTNTGNVGRVFFQNAERVSQLIGVKQNIIERLYTVLQVMSCGKEVHLDKFKTFCIETAKECVKSYPWYKMPPSVHKVLIHGPDIMQEFDAPMIWFSEEPQEAQNKVFRRARSEHSRMFQRTSTNEDIMHYMLIHSDVAISTIRQIRTKEKRNLTPAAKSFVKES